MKVKQIHQHLSMFFLLFLSSFFTTIVVANSGGSQWTSAGQNIQNTRHQQTENKISTTNAEQLLVKWQTTTGGNVSATPAVDGSAVYFPDFAGNLFKLDKLSGEVLWQHQISEYNGIPGTYARTTPAMHGNLLIFGDQAGRQFRPGEAANLIAVDRHTGDLVWKTVLDEHPAAIITQSATVNGNIVYVGVASYEEAFAAFYPGYVCCSFRGSMLALNANTGAIIWKTYTTAEGFSGNAIWGSSPAVDTKRGLVYVATGNNYSAPDAFLACVEDAGDDANAQRVCLEPYNNNYFDSVIALNIKTGEVEWATSVIPFDVWTVSCLFGFPNCPTPEGPDFDFGQAPMLMNVKAGKKNIDLLGVGQKSGVFWALSPDTGEIVWRTQVSPGGVAGGIMWGSAFDGQRIYVSSSNSEYKSWLLPDASSTNAGIWSALDPTTGAILWQTANPTGANAGGAIAAANQVVYACSQDDAGYMFAMNATSGEIIWSFASGGSCNSGAAIVNGEIFWGSGYNALGPGTVNDRFYSFGLPK